MIFFYRLTVSNIATFAINVSVLGIQSLNTGFQKLRIFILKDLFPTFVSLCKLQILSSNPYNTHLSTVLFHAIALQRLLIEQGLLLSNICINTYKAIQFNSSLHTMCVHNARLTVSTDYMDYQTLLLLIQGET